MSCDPVGLQYAKDYFRGKPAPKDTAPGPVSMSCGATKHSNLNVFNTTSPAVPIGPHWMIFWPYDAAHERTSDNGA